MRDASGAAIPKATVTLTNQDTGIQAKTTTDENGNYDFFNVRVGRYAIAVEQTGFSKFTTTDVAVNVNARQRVDVAMQVGAVTESVEVKGAAAALETDSSEHGQVISTAAVAELPLNGRNYADLALLIHQRRQVSDLGLLLGHRHAARGRVQRQRHAQHL